MPLKKKPQLGGLAEPRLMREFLFIRSCGVSATLALLMPATSFAQALFAEANFSDQQYSALIENQSIEETDLRSAFSGFQLFLVKARILDVYYGDVKAGDEIEIQVNVAYLGMKRTLENMTRPYILSFCSSDSGVYFTNRDFLIIPANDINVKEFNRLKAEGTDFDGNNDCSSTNFDLEPISTD